MGSHQRLSIRSFVIGLLLAPLPAGAGTLTSATWIQTAQGLQSLTQGIPLTRTASDPRWSYSGTSTSTAIAANVNYFFTSTIFGVPKTPNGVLDLGVHVTQGGTQAIAATAAGAAGSPGIGGRVIVAAPLPIHVGMGASQSMISLGAFTIVSIPLSIGNAGGFTNTFIGALNNGTITISFYSWTVGAVVFTGLTSLYSQTLPSVSAMGSFNLTANGGGMVTLVSPSVVDIDHQSIPRRTASITTLVLNFVPEPSSLLLISAGALALLLSSQRTPR